MMIQAIICRVGGRPHKIEFRCTDDHLTVIGNALRCPGRVARLPLTNGIELWCDRNGLLLGLGFARRAIVAGIRALSSLRDKTPPSEPHDWDLDVALSNWPASADFALVRVGASGELMDMSMADLGLWEILLGFDYIQYRP
jgi:hypothetical protein